MKYALLALATTITHTEAKINTQQARTISIKVLDNVIKAGCFISGALVNTSIYNNVQEYQCSFVNTLKQNISFIAIFSILCKLLFISLFDYKNISSYIKDYASFFIHGMILTDICIIYKNVFE